MASGTRINAQERQRELKRLGRVLREIRSGAGLRQVDVAERLGKPQAYVARFEGGVTRLDLYELRQVCRVYGLTLAELAARFERRG